MYPWVTLKKKWQQGKKYCTVQVRPYIAATMTIRTGNISREKWGASCHSTLHCHSSRPGTITLAHLLVMTPWMYVWNHTQIMNNLQYDYWQHTKWYHLIEYKKGLCECKIFILHSRPGQNTSIWKLITLKWKSKTVKRVSINQKNFLMLLLFIGRNWVEVCMDQDQQVKKEDE